MLQWTDPSEIPPKLAKVQSMTDVYPNLIKMGQFDRHEPIVARATIAPGLAWRLAGAGGPAHSHHRALAQGAERRRHMVAGGSRAVDDRPPRDPAHRPFFLHVPWRALVHLRMALRSPSGGRIQPGRHKRRRHLGGDR